MKRNVKLFENFDERPMRPTPVVRPVEEEQTPIGGQNQDALPPQSDAVPGEDIVFDPARADEFSFKDDKDRLVVNANFGEGSFLGSFHPNEGREVLWLMPRGVEEVGYLGHGDGVGWVVTFKKGTTFEQGWNMLRDHEGSIMLTLKRLGSNRKWDFEGFAPMEDTGIQMVNK